ncbi:MAG: hypothetical protein RLZZ301_522 [Bacteroidota bacterium]|jgi:hypothetical protein
MKLLQEDRINFLNIGLMLVTAVLAYFFPFETFLLAYAYLGPLHYLTEISWLHDRNYYAKGKFDYWILVIIGLALTYAAYAKDFGFSKDVYDYFVEMNLFDKLLVFALFASILFALVKNLWVKLIAIFMLYVFVAGWLSPERAAANSESTTVFALTALIPTLIHVYVFTGLFMLYGSLKTRSKSGMWQMVAFVTIPLILVFALPTDPKHGFLSKFGKEAYYAKGDGFYMTNYLIMDHFDLVQDKKLSNQEYLDIITKPGNKNYFIQQGIISDSNFLRHVDSLKAISSRPFMIKPMPLNTSNLAPQFQYDHLLYFFDTSSRYVSEINKYRNQALPKKIMKSMSKKETDDLVYYSNIGLMLMRFFAFAYLYHYLNWFSKTEIIRWHKVPKARFLAVIIFWLASCVFYAYDYSLGLSLLFLFSFAHVLLEFPLNIVSIVGIGTESLSIFKNGFKRPE